MEEIWEIKRRKSDALSRDPRACLAAMRREEEEAAAMGLSYLEYCLKKIEASSPQSVTSKKLWQPTERNPLKGEVIAKPQEISHAKFAKYAKFGSHGYFANVADFA